MLGRTQRVTAPTALPRAMESACCAGRETGPRPWAPPCKPRCGDTRGRQREGQGGLNRGAPSAAFPRAMYQQGLARRTAPQGVAVRAATHAAAPPVKFVCKCSCQVACGQTAPGFPSACQLKPKQTKHRPMHTCCLLGTTAPVQGPAAQQRAEGSAQRAGSHSVEWY